MDPHSTVAAPSSSEMPEPERSVSPRNVIEAGMQLKATRSVLPTVSSKSVNGILGRSAADNPLQTDKKSMMALIRRSVTMSPSLFRKHTPVSHAASSTAPPSSVQIASAANGIRPSFYWCATKPPPCPPLAMFERSTEEAAGTHHFLFVAQE